MAERVERPLPPAEVACPFITEQRCSLYWSQPSPWCSRRESPGPGRCVYMYVCVCVHVCVRARVCVCVRDGGLPKVRVEETGIGSPYP